MGNLEKQFKLHRAVELTRDGFKEEGDELVYELKFTSREPYKRFFGYEIIDLNTIDLTRLNNGAPLLYNHDRSLVIGKVEKAWIDGDFGYCTVRFSNAESNDTAKKVRELIEEDILGKVSFGYSVEDYKYIGNNEEDGEEIYEVKTTPFEVSIVTVPADDTVGIIRSLTENEEEQEKLFNQILQKKSQDNKIKEESNLEIKEVNSEEENINIEQTKEKNNMGNEVQAVKEMIEYGELFNVGELARDFASEGKTLEDLKNAVKALRKTDNLKPVKEEEVREVQDPIEDAKKRMLKEAGSSKNLNWLKSFSSDDLLSVFLNGKREYGGAGAGKESSGKEWITKDTKDKIVDLVSENDIINLSGFTVDQVNASGGNVYRLLTKVATFHDTDGGKAVVKEEIKTESVEILIKQHSSYFEFNHDLLAKLGQGAVDYVINMVYSTFYNTACNAAVKGLYDAVTLSHTPVSADAVSYKDLIGLDKKINNRVYTVDSNGNPTKAFRYIASGNVYNDMLTTERFAGSGVPILTDGAKPSERMLNSYPIVENRADVGASKEYVLYGDMAMFHIVFGNAPIIDVQLKQGSTDYVVTLIGYFGCGLLDPKSVVKVEYNKQS